MEKVVKIRGTGANSSYIVTLPKEFVKKLKWRKGQKVVVELDGERIVVRDWEG